MKFTTVTTPLATASATLGATRTSGFATRTRNPQVINREDTKPLGSAISGALAPTPAPLAINMNPLDPPPGHNTISLINHAGVDLLTRHNLGHRDPFRCGCDSPIGGVPPQDVLRNGDTGLLVAPTGWEGAISINNAKYGGFKEDESLFEASFMVQPLVADFAVLDIDVSFVNGFSYPIVCRCERDNL